MSKTQKTYTHEQVEDLMHLALRNWGRELDEQFESLENDKGFELGLLESHKTYWSESDVETQLRELSKFKVTPSDYLYYAKGDTSVIYPCIIQEAFEEYEKPDELRKLLKRGSK